MCYVIDTTNIFFLLAHTHTHTFGKNKVSPKTFQCGYYHCWPWWWISPKVKKSKVKHLIATSNFVKFHHCIMNDNDHKTKQKLYSPYLFVVTLCIQAIEIVKAWKISRPISMSFNLKKSKGCKWDNMSDTFLLLGLLLVEYFKENFQIFKFF
jgi:hypothetical protein